MLMMDFNLKPYEWQENMDVIMQNVNLNRISVEKNFTMTFDFLNRCDGAEYKKITCSSVWMFSSSINMPTEGFPFFVCDVRTIKLKDCDVQSAFEHFRFGLSIPESDEYILLCVDDGDLSIALICKKIEIYDA